jgi:predicted lysophospholipase L1 biosynthesis ABC-type transport system permease subunit
MPKELSLNWPSDISIMSLMISLLLGVVLSIILSWHFKRFGSTLSNREEFANVFPFVLLTTVLIISVIKSSLALSLGLVGALSIIRFRTPIKEPEELAYLFMAIAMGLGLGANRIALTVVSSLSILTFMAVFKWKRNKVENKNLYLSIDWQAKGEEVPERYLERLNEILIKHLKRSDLRRFDARKESVEATYLVKIIDPNNLNKLVEELRRTFPAIGVTFIDQNNMPSV